MLLIQGDAIKRVVTIKNGTHHPIRLRIERTKLTGGLDRSLPLNEVNALFPKTGAMTSVAAGLSTQIEIRIVGRQIGKILENISIRSEKATLGIRIMGHVTPVGSEVWFTCSFNCAYTRECCLCVPSLHDITMTHARDEQQPVNEVLLPPDLTSQEMKDLESFPRLVKECLSTQPTLLLKRVVVQFLFLSQIWCGTGKLKNSGCSSHISFGR